MKKSLHRGDSVISVDKSRSIETQSTDQQAHVSAALDKAYGKSSILLVCEHASNFIPKQFDRLGLSAEEQGSHIAWDPGAMAVARILSELLDAKLVHSRVSRLVYDCNRPPDAVGAMSLRSEDIEVPGNCNLTAQDKAARVGAFYNPFRDLVATTIANASSAVIIVTIHSFTPIYLGESRNVDIGILHDSDARLADAMLAQAAHYPGLRILRNIPYGPEDGVTHTLKVHGIENGLLNVMLEIRNDLIDNSAQQQAMAEILASMLTIAVRTLDANPEVTGAKCRQ